MAQKFDRELIQDTTAEHKRNKKNRAPNQTEAMAAAAAPVDPVTVEKHTQEPEQKQTAAGAASPGPDQSTAAGSPLPPPPPPPVDEFQQRFEEYFKGTASIASGAVIVNLIDDLKANGLLLYAKKNKIDGITRDMLSMDKNSKEFTAFLVDHAIKNNLWDWVKKYPLGAAAAVFGVSTGGTFLMLQALKRRDTEAQAQEKEIEKLRSELAGYKGKKETVRREQAEVVTSETVPEKSASEDTVRETIKFLDAQT